MEKAGIGGSLILKKEAAYGTYIAPSNALPFTKESIKRSNAYVKTASIKAGQLAQADQQHTQTTHDAAGGYDMDVLGAGFGSILDQLHGNVVTPTVVVAGTVFTQQHDVGLVSPNGKSRTVQVNRPDVGGTLRSFSYVGGKVVTVTFNMAVGGVLTATVDWDYKDEDTTQAAVTAAYDTIGRNLPFQGGSCLFDDVLLTDCVQSAQIVVTIPLKTDRYCIGGGATKKEQVLNNQIAVTADLTMEFSNLTQHAAFQNGTRRKFAFKSAGSLLDATHPQELDITLPSTVTVDSGPVIDGPDLITQAVKLEGVITGANPLATFLYQTSDATIV